MNKIHHIEPIGFEFIFDSAEIWSSSFNVYEKLLEFSNYGLDEGSPFMIEYDDNCTIDNLQFKFVSKKEYLLKDYIYFQYSNLSKNAFNEIVILELKELENRIEKEEEEVWRRKEYFDDQPGLRDAFDDYDQFNTWDISR